MGCCAICETANNEGSPFGKPDVGLRDIQHLNVLRYDPYALELHNYSLELRRSTEWTTNAELPLVTIKSIPESRYSSAAPVFCLALKPLKKVDLSEFVRLVLDPCDRLTWDMLISLYHELPTEGHKVYYTMYEFPFPFSNRDFIESAAVIPSSVGLQIVKYSTSECEVSSKHERAYTHFFVATAEVKGDQTEITVVGQIDLSLPFKQQILMNYAKAIFEDWDMDREPDSPHDVPHKKPKLSDTSDPVKFTMDERGRLLDSKGRAIDLPRSSVFSLSINQEKAAKKGMQNASRYLNASKQTSTSFSRDHFFDPNLPKRQKKDRQTMAGFVFGDEAKAIETVRADIVPNVEWWDRAILTGDEYSAAAIDYSKITDEIDQPVPVYTAPINTTSHSVVMHLTERERKKIKRLKKAKKLKEMREKVKLGLAPAPPQKIKLSNMMKLMAKEVSVDPSKTEQEVMEKYNQRLQDHHKRNESRKLTKAQKQERELRRLRRDSARESRTALFRIERLQHKKNIFKLVKNAEQLALVGACLRLPPGLPVLLAVEGGKQALKLYKKLCLRRVDWALEDPPGNCALVWEAEIKDAVFRRFSFKDVDSELDARKLLAERGVERYFDLVTNWKPPTEL